jgi:hypothetical protein
LLGFVGDGPHVVAADQADHRLRVEKGDHHALGRVLAHDHVARQQQADIGLGLQRPVRERRIAGTRYAKGRKPGPGVVPIAPINGVEESNAEA